MPEKPTHRWSLDPEIVFLNHGSFGACPLPVLEQQRHWQDRMEREPVRFFVNDLEGLLDEAVGFLARFLGADAEDVVFLPNATAGINAVLRSMALESSDEIVITNHAYNACANAVHFVAERAGASVVVANVPYPLESSDQIVQAIMGVVTPRTRLAVLSHITSATGIILPLERLVEEMEEAGVESLVDGAHAPGMIDVNLNDIGAAYYAGNCHKWLCAPKGAGFLHVRRDLQDSVRPLSISHGANTTRTNRSSFKIEFDWIGTDDPSAYLCVPTAIKFMESLLPGGWEELRNANRSKALEGRRVLCESLGAEAPVPEEMIGSLASLSLPDGSPEPPSSPLYTDPLQQDLMARYGIQVPVVPWPAPPRRLLRVSAQIYNHPQDYIRLASALMELLSN